MPWDPYTDESASEPEEVVAGSTRQRRSVDEEVLEYVSGLRRYALLLVGDPHDADDLVQECLVRVIAQARSWRQVNDLRAYLFTTLHNIFVDGHRRRHKHRGDVPIETVIADLLAPPRQQDWVELRDLIAALQVLPKEQREVVLLVGLEGLSYLEAANVIGVPVGTVMSRLSRGREALRRLITHGATTRLRVVK